MGGMQALEWAVMYPDRLRSIVVMASCAALSAQQIAYNAVQRSTIALDPKWRGGDYYDAVAGEGPHFGLALARQLAQITYRTDGVFDDRFGRDALDLTDTFSPWQRFDVEGYLDYHGAKLARRFDANSYLVIAKAMDLHDLGRGRGGVEAALRRIHVPVLVGSINSDVLYPPHQQSFIRDQVVANGGHCTDLIIDSPDGHDAFLLATDQVARALGPFLDEVEKPDV